MVRNPAVAGQFYPGSEDAIEKKIEECFMSDIGPGEIPEDEGDSRNIKGLVVPHAGYDYSGPVAVHAYKKLFEDGFPDTFIICGPNHRGFGGDIALSDEDFKTPMGVAKTDKELVEEIADDEISVINRAHMGEHSIEVQLPFLQYFSDDFKIVPITFTKQNYRSSKKIGERIKEKIEGKDVVIIASTDFSHYVLKETAEKKDKMAIDKIIDNDPKGLYEIVQKESISMCGYGPVMTMMIGSGGNEGELLKYATSGDVMPMKEVVGYGSLIFY